MMRWRQNQTRLITHLLALCFACMALTTTARADIGVIELKQSAKLAPGASALLSDVADLTGEPAQSLAGTVIRKPSAGAMSFQVTTADIRSALSARDANWGRLTLRGSTCQVRVGDQPLRRITKKKTGEAAPATIDLTGPRTVRTRLAELVARMFNVENEDLRLRFDDRDTALLSQSINDRARVEIQPASSASSSRLSFVIWLYEGENLEPSSTTIRVDALIRRSIVTTSKEIRRGDTVSASDVTEATQWMAPNGSAPITGAEQAIGMRARRKIDAGAMIRADTLEPPIACDRGDLVKVHCVSGGIIVKAWARAQAKAHEGDFVELRMTGSKKTFQARMTGRGVAVMNLAG